MCLDRTLPVSQVANYVLDQIKSDYEPYAPSHNGLFEETIYLGTGNILADVLDYRGDIEGMSHYELIGNLCATIDALISPQTAWKLRSQDGHGTELRYSWTSFVGEIKYRRRFLFLSADKSKNGRFLPKHSAEEIMKIIGDALVELKLIKELDELEAGKKIYRARLARNGEVFNGKEQLGAPSPKRATAERMNPPGIPYFYAAFDRLTACAEVCGDKLEPLNTVYVSTWEVKKQLKVVDLSRLGVLPSYFDPKKRISRSPHLFLRDFIRDACSPRPEDDTAQLTYIPAQVMSEYFRTVLQVDGVIFTSTKNRDGRCVVIFPDDDDDIIETGLFDNKLKLCDQTEKKLVGIEPDLIISRVVVDDLDNPWEVSS